jgi:EAL and modified HD-GYP domain-containing signal transduction protein
MRRWIILAALPQMAADKPSELALLSIVRGQFCQRIAECAGLPEHNGAFLVGLFSLLDALIDRPLDQALAEVKLAPALTDVLLGVGPLSAPLASVYKLARSYESGDWDSVQEFAAQLDVPVSTISDAYVDSTRWANDLLRQIPD